MSVECVYVQGLVPLIDNIDIIIIFIISQCIHTLSQITIILSRDTTKLINTSESFEFLDR